MKPTFEPAPQNSVRKVRSAWVDFRPGVAAAVGGIFIYAGILKVPDPVGFAGDVSNFHLLPWPLGVALAFYLPWLEILCGGALFLGWKRGGAIALLTALTAIFIGATLIARLRGINVNCGCFGTASKDLSFGWHLVLDFAILAALLLLWRWYRGDTRRATGR